jgi:hypothetical protein
MSYDLQVYARKGGLPSARTLAEAISRDHPRLTLTDPIDLNLDKGFRPLLLDGKPTGFYLGRSEVTAEDIEDYIGDVEDSGGQDEGYLAVLKSSDVVIHLSGQKAPEIEAAEMVAEAITRLSKGVLIDPQKGT